MADVHLPVNLGNPTEMTIRAVGRGRQPVDRQPGGADASCPISRAPADPQRRQPDIRRAREWLQWEPKTDLDAGPAQDDRGFPRPAVRPGHAPARSASVTRFIKFGVVGAVGAWSISACSTCCPIALGLWSMCRQCAVVLGGRQQQLPVEPVLGLPGLASQADHPPGDAVRLGQLRWRLLIRTPSSRQRSSP